MACTAFSASKKDLQKILLCDVQKEIYLPKLEQDEGIISYGAFESSENTLVLFEFWTSHDAKHSFDEKLNADENVYEKFMPLMEGFTDYYGEPYAIRQFVDFKAGESIKLKSPLKFNICWTKEDMTLMR